MEKLPSLWCAVLIKLVQVNCLSKKINLLQGSTPGSCFKTYSLSDHQGATSLVCVKKNELVVLFLKSLWFLSLDFLPHTLTSTLAQITGE